MARLDELWKSVDGPGTPPGLDSRRVKARVNAALDADRAERKIYMKQKLRVTLAVAAAVAALTGSAFAASAIWSGLSNWFGGNPAPIQEYIDSTVRTAADQDYSMTVEGAAADESSAYLTVTITALSDKAKEFLWDEEFRGMDLFYVTPVFDEAQADAGFWSGPANRELECSVENTRRFALDMANLPASTSALRVRCGYMERDKVVEVPLTPAPSRTVKINASGTGVIAMGASTLAGPGEITIDKITCSPLTIHLYAAGEYGAGPNIRLRMTDGSIRTQSQMMHFSSSSSDALTHRQEFHYRFKDVQDLDNIVSFIVFDMEYPLDGSQPTRVDHDPALDPFTVTRTGHTGDGYGFTVPVRELTEKLGGVCVWDPATGGVTCTFRGVDVVLRAGQDTALVDGRTVALISTPVHESGVLTADLTLFEDAWGIDGFVQRETIRNEKDPAGVTINWGDWYIIP